MTFLNRILVNGISLKYIIMLPICILIVILTTVIGWTSYRSTAAAVSDLIDTVSGEIIDEIEIVTNNFLNDADVVLNAFSANDSNNPDTSDYNNSEETERRLWHLSGISESVSNIAFGKLNGDLIGVRRIGKQTHTTIKDSIHKQKTIFTSARPGDRTKLLKVDPDAEVLTKDWYKMAIEIDRATWSPISISTARNKLHIRRSKPVRENSNKLVGVVVTDKSLDQLSFFISSFKKSKLSANSEAFIIEKNGDLVATTESLTAQTKDKLKAIRVKGSESASPLVRLGAKYVEDNLQKLGTPGKKTKVFKINGDNVHLAFKKIEGLSELEWYAVVLAPESDYNQSFVAATKKTILIATGLLILFIVIVGGFLKMSLHDLEVLTHASKKFGSGADPGVLHIERSDEIGFLAKSFNTMVTEIKIHQHELEGRVRDRTKDLAAKNSELIDEISKRKLAQEKILQLFSALELSDEAIAVFDPDHRIKFVNPAFVRLCGYTMQDMQSEKMNLLSSGRLGQSSTTEKILKNIKRKLENGKTFRGVVSSLKKSGDIYDSDMTITPIFNGQNQLIAYNLIERDVTLNVKAKDDMLARLRTDKLTDLLNRDALIKDVTESFLHATNENTVTNISEFTMTNVDMNSRPKSKNRFAVIYMDLNKFKEINDTLGHEYGDVTLVVAGKRMKSCIGQNDLLARLGGDEFVAVVRDVNSTDEAVAVGLKIENSVKLPMQIKDKKVEVGVSFGVALYPDDGEDLDALLRAADEEMYKAKRASRSGGDKLKVA